MLTHPVMAGLVPAIHVWFAALKQQDMDARHKAGHDGVNLRQRDTL
jgi:hypothetical protein